MRPREKLCTAARDGSLEDVIKLLDSGCNINWKGSKGLTPLQEATKAGQLEVVSLLLNHNAEFEQKGTTSLHLACGGGHMQIAELLIEHGAVIDQPDQSHKGYTPIFNAVENNHIEVVKLLLRNKAKFNIKNAKKETPLMIATKKEYKDIEDLLVKMHTLTQKDRAKPQKSANKKSGGRRVVGSSGKIARELAISVIAETI
uniref:Uncharacterized protein n=1 Tax=Rhodosorus marinus TaxID=101924 RepID=A0A7S2ZFX6_9RHOD|mmetsp:Transcript_17016/g.69246  ORF Transcript_17016/g.69246 Transcript_17016/m.69246 type:complete len:201 (+) Transcript_17016:309-911(+)|eukprot:CAMPEP_0113954532 /NCGR_PEP_ID=MMETSP0011_2-20120614/626_1 /TAXON_ID=101924 /ORGANISM="Rhodosorus marinus" /LENGTH=200 /DNA_ID=CAMNT_0000963713 /DNA_START=188 /DNA_END=790 /DNA_ORIENTATION=- /assembly_acc=CAM_ASM_000156